MYEPEDFGVVDFLLVGFWGYLVCCFFLLLRGGNLIALNVGFLPILLHGGIWTIDFSVAVFLTPGFNWPEIRVLSNLLEPLLNGLENRHL